MAQQEAPTPPAQHWSFDGLFGTYDLAAAQRGFQVYSEVCSVCHSMQYLHYRDLAGIGLTEDQIKAIAAAVTVPQGLNDQGDPKEGPGTPADQFKLAVPRTDAGERGRAPQRRPAAGPVADRQCPRRPRRLRLRHPDRLRRSAARHADAGRDELQQVLPRPSDRHAAAAARRPGDLRRRHARHGRADGARRGHVPAPGRRIRRWSSASRSACAGCCSS